MCTSKIHKSVSLLGNKTVYQYMMRFADTNPAVFASFVSASIIYWLLILISYHFCFVL